MKSEHPKNCPFCKHTLSLYEYERAICSNCGASWVPNCPKCNNPTWMNKRLEYKHSTPNKCKYDKY